MPFTLDVDVARKTPGGVPYSEHVADYVMLSRAEEKYMPNGKVQYVNHQKYFVQLGKVYENGGKELHPDAVPAWVWEEYARIVPETRKAVGLLLPADRQRELERNASDLLDQFDKLPDEVKQQLLTRLGTQAPRIDEKAPAAKQVSTYPETTISQPEPSQAPKMWVCENCSEEMRLTLKGTHIARWKKHGRCS